MERLIDIVAKLRSPDGCPWDREQTHGSIKRNLLEEAYEAAEAIEKGDAELLREELGDVLMQVVFHADIEEKAGVFNLDDIADAACKKLIRRHPHVFGGAAAENSGEVLEKWDSIKREEKRHETTADEMRSVAGTLPALWRAEKIQGKAAKSGFGRQEHSVGIEALQNGLLELSCAIASGEGIAGRLGDMLFSVVNVARFFGVDPEDALGLTCDKFISRFALIESAARASGRGIDEMTLGEMGKLQDG